MKFISYSGRWPNLCSGVLMLEIDGEEITFGIDYSKDWKEQLNSPTYNPRFWSSGGYLDDDYCAHEGEWLIDKAGIPERFRQYAAEIDYVFNENVPYGCCGGCA